MRCGRGSLLGLGLMAACGGSPTTAGGTEGATGGSTAAAPTGLETDPLPGGTADGTTASNETGPPPGTTTSGPAVDSTSTGEGPPPGSFEECFEQQFVNDPPIFPDYDQFDPVVGTHCRGTDHQDIDGIERVVFLGDSITVGSRPTLPQDAYRARLADMLRDQFGLAYGDPLSETLWKAPNPLTGQSIEPHSGDFSSCAEWGARNDDLTPPGTQLEDCFPEDVRQARTLVVMTSGGNDISSLAQDAIAGIPIEELWTITEEFVQLERDAVEWLVAPGRFPNGVFVVFANIYEFTDGTSDVQSCDVSGLAGFEDPVPNPMELTELIVWANEQYMSVAVDTGTDMYLMLETFCGHGFNHDDPTAPCYRGPDTPLYFDLTCIHPNPMGHGVISDDFMSIVLE